MKDQYFFFEWKERQNALELEYDVSGKGMEQI